LTHPALNPIIKANKFLTPAEKKKRHDMSNEAANPFQIKTKVLIKKLKGLFVYALNPAKILTENKQHKWHLHLILPAAGWMLFFMQVALDKNDMYYVSAGSIVLFSLLGLVAGYITVGLVGWLTSFILGLMQKKISYGTVISCIAMSHTYMFISLVMGFIYRAFGMSSSAVFGIAGLLCTLLPIYSGLRTLGKQSAFFAPLMATLIGVLLLGVWNLIMLIPV
jgi:hypothetical protein